MKMCAGSYKHYLSINKLKAKGDDIFRCDSQGGKAIGEAHTSRRKWIYHRIITMTRVDDLEVLKWAIKISVPYSAINEYLGQEF